MSLTFDEALERARLRPFQWVTFAICMLVLVGDGIDLQLLGLVAPVIIEDWGVDRGSFGWAMSAALIGMVHDAEGRKALWEQLQFALDGEPDPWFEFDKAEVDTRQFVPIAVARAEGVSA